MVGLSRGASDANAGETSDGIVVFINQLNRLGAAQVGENAYVIFEYGYANPLSVGDRLLGLTKCVGQRIVHVVRAQGQNEHLPLNILSSAMGFDRAKLVVAPWQDVRCTNQRWEIA